MVGRLWRNNTLTAQSEFNELVNMSADELAEWLKGDASVSSGWTKNGTGETVGHQRYSLGHSPI